MKNYCLFIVTFMAPGSYIASNRGDKFYHPCLNLGPPLFISSLNSLLFKQLGGLGKSRKKVEGCEVYFQGRFHGRRRCRIVRSLIRWCGLESITTKMNTFENVLGWTQPKLFCCELLLKHSNNGLVKKKRSIVLKFVS